MGAAVAGTFPKKPKSRRPKPCVAPAEALTTAYTASSRSGSPAIPSDRVLHHAMGRDQGEVELPSRSTFESLTIRALEGLGGEAHRHAIRDRAIGLGR